MLVLINTTNTNFTMAHVELSSDLEQEESPSPPPSPKLSKGKKAKAFRASKAVPAMTKKDQRRHNATIRTTIFQGTTSGSN